MRNWSGHTLAVQVPGVLIDQIIIVVIQNGCGQGEGPVLELLGHPVIGFSILPLEAHGFCHRFIRKGHGQRHHCSVAGQALTGLSALLHHIKPVKGIEQRQIVLGFHRLPSAAVFNYSGHTVPNGNGSAQRDFLWRCSSQSVIQLYINHAAIVSTVLCLVKGGFFLGGVLFFGRITAFLPMVCSSSPSTREKFCSRSVRLPIVSSFSCKCWYCHLRQNFLPLFVL